MLQPDEVVSAFEAMLGRAPESDAVVEHFRTWESVGALMHALAGSDEYRQRTAPASPFLFFNTRFDAEALVTRHEDPARGPVEGMCVNYFGVKVPQKVLPRAVVDHIPAVEAHPLPANWHADTAEFAAALRAVELAGDTFTMLELGCGWGCWMNITGVVARNAGKKVHLVGIEGDRHNFELAEEALEANAFTPADYALHHGIAHAQSGRALFPQQGADEESWGLEPVFSTDPEAYEAAKASGRYTELPMVGFDALAAEHGRFDLVHIDIQGGEAALVAAASAALTRSVAYLVIGTHGRAIEGAIIDTLTEAGWVLEIERPAIMDLKAMFATVDGVQGWRNPALI